MKIVEYLKRHDWEWMTEEQIIQATGCTKEEIADLANDIYHMRLIESFTANGITEYRYIGNQSSATRKAVELLKNRYPEWLSCSQIEKVTGHTILKSLSKKYGIAPVVRRTIYANRTQVTQYQYVPNDKCSIQDRTFPLGEYSSKIHAGQVKRERIFEIVKLQSPKWLSAKQILAKSEYGQVNAIISVLNSLVNDNQIERCIGIDGRKSVYRYVGEA